MHAHEYCSHLRSYRLLWTLRLRSVSDNCQKKVGMSRIQDVWISSGEQFGGILWLYYGFFSRLKIGYHLPQSFERLLQHFFSCETPAVWCGLKNFTQPSICIRVSKWWWHFHFWVNYPFNKHSHLILCYMNTLNKAALMSYQEPNK